MLEDLKLDIQKLISLYETSAQRCAELESKVAELQGIKESYGNKINELNRQIDNLKLGGAFTGAKVDNAESKERLTRLISEIDKCIALLEN